MKLKKLKAKIREWASNEKMAEDIILILQNNKEAKKVIGYIYTERDIMMFLFSLLAQETLKQNQIIYTISA